MGFIYSIPLQIHRIGGRTEFLNPTGAALAAAGTLAAVVGLAVVGGRS